MKHRPSILLAIALFASSPAYASDLLSVSGNVAAEGRMFFAAPRHLGQRLGTGPSIAATPRFSLQDERGTHTLTIEPFVRVDSIDSARTHYDLRRADYEFFSGGFSFGIGVGSFSSGVLDGHRVVDIVNQRDLVEDIDGHVKLGQPYVGLGYEAGAWSLSFQYLPYFRNRTFPGERGRIRFPLIVDPDGALYESRFGAWHPSFNARVSVSAGDFDIGLSGFSGLSREPRFFGQVSRPNMVVPQYDFLQQGAVDVQWTIDALIFKAEVAGRWWSEDLRFFVAAGGGATYQFFDVFRSGVDVGIVAEYHFDNRTADAAITFFDNDVVGALRIAINDSGDTTITAGAAVDVATTTTYGRAAVERRFGESWKASVETRLFFGREGRLESGLLNDNHAQAVIAHYF